MVLGLWVYAVSTSLVAWPPHATSRQHPQRVDQKCYRALDDSSSSSNSANSSSSSSFGQKKAFGGLGSLFAGRGGTRMRRRFGTVLALAGGAAAVARKERPRPVVMVHGILDCAANMLISAQWIREALGKGAYIRAIEIGNGVLDSIQKPMEWQLQRLAEQIQADPELYDGFNMIGYSQGSLLARAFVQRYDWPRCHVLVSWAGP